MKLIHCAKGALAGVGAVAVAGVLAASAPAPVEFVNGGDRFGRSGSPAELMQAYGFTGGHIAEIARKAVARKK